MLDPRALAEDRERILASCKARGVDVDVDAAIAAQERWAAAMTRLNEANRQRAEHRALGKGGSEAASRGAHVAEGRRIKQEIAGLESQLAEAAACRDALLLQIPNQVHPRNHWRKRCHLRLPGRPATP